VAFLPITAADFNFGTVDITTTLLTEIFQVFHNPFALKGSLKHIIPHICDMIRSLLLV